jgi:hypothetical protein
MIASLRLSACLSAFALLLAHPAAALDPGTADGRYVENGLKLEFSHAVAVAQDNAEGLLEHPAQVRVLLSDVEVAPEALYGIAFPPVRAMARAGAVRGLLLEFDPADRNSLTISVLAHPADPAQTLSTLSLSNSEGLWRRLDVGATRVTGELQPRDDQDLGFRFSAPVFTDPVRADLRGPAARASEQMRVLKARLDALARGDLPAAQALTAKTSVAALPSLPPAMLKGALADYRRQLDKVDRVVVRQKTAAVLLPGHSWSSLVLEDGAWKVAN